VFRTDLLRDASNTIARDGITATDEVSAVEQLGTKVKFVESQNPNLKITTPADLALAEAMVKIQTTR
jgi:2-C-methyl-D-erythritol 4-phosphate cytidylyltransferase